MRMEPKELHTELMKRISRDQSELVRWRDAVDHAKEKVAHYESRIHSASLVAGVVMGEIQDANRKADSEAPA